MIAQLDASFDAHLSATLEGMAFADCVRADDQDFQWEDPDLFWSCIQLIRPISGRLSIVAGRAPAEALAGAITGAPCGDPVEIREILGEVANTIGGRWLKAQDARGEGIELGLPTTGRGPCPRIEGAQVVVYETDDGEIGVAFSSQKGEEE